MGAEIKNIPRWKKRLYFPVTLICCGIAGWTQWRNPPDDKDKLRYSHLFGFDSLEMQVHWDRLAHSDEPWYHMVKNLGVEWCRLDPQRGIKITSMLFLWVTLIALLLGMIFGALMVGAFL